MVSAGADTTAGGSVISLPSGGGAVSGLGETFSPDLFTGTGNFSVPIALPAGRHGVQPQLGLAYSTGNGNGMFGLGWALSLPGVARKTSRGLPRYLDGDGSRPDTFVLSGVEDLVAVSGGDRGRVRYRPRTEGTFARIEHVRDTTGDHWEVRGRDGMLTRYGTRKPADADAAWRDPAVVGDPGPGREGRIFAWKITETADVCGNRLTLPLTADDFPRNLADLEVTQLTLFVVRDQSLTAELTVSAVRHTAAGVTTDAGPVITRGAVAGTRHPGSAPWQVFAGTPPAGDWELQLEDTAAVRSWFAHEQIQDLVVVFTISAVVPAWP